MTEKIELEALEDFICKNQDLQELEKRFEKFNIFDCLKLSNNEIRHSNFLGWLLDPKETHGLGDFFLKEFLKKILYENKVCKKYNCPTIFDIDCWDLSNIELRREYRNIDLLIIDEENKFVFVIENKIWTSQHDDQLTRYREIVEDEFADSEYKKLFVYLKPKAEQIEEPYIYVSYKAVIEVLKLLLDTKCDKMSSEIYTAIKHYKEMIERDIMNEDEIKKICKRIYSNHKKAIDLINKHNSDTVKDIAEILQEIIEEQQDWKPQDSCNSIIRFITKKLDKMELKYAYNYVASNQVLIFELMNNKNNLSLDIVVGQVQDKDKEKKKELCQSISEKIQNSKKTEFNKNWAHIASFNILSSDDYDRILDMSKEEIKSLILSKIKESGYIEALESIL